MVVGKQDFFAKASCFEKVWKGVLLAANFATKSGQSRQTLSFSVKEDFWIRPKLWPKLTIHQATCTRKASKSKQKLREDFQIEPKQWTRLIFNNATSITKNNSHTTWIREKRQLAPRLNASLREIKHNANWAKFFAVILGCFNLNELSKFSIRH